MAGKKNARSEPAAAPATTATSTPSAKAPLTPTKNPIPIPTPAQPKAVAAQGGWAQVFQNLYDYYLSETPQRTKLLDVFLLFLVLVGALQFLYCILAGNYPFNAFLSGFCGTVGQFVLTISLRIQTTEANKADFPKVSPERAFADYVVCSLILHFFCVNFIN